MKINIYDNVSVILTEKGANVVNNYYHTKPTNNESERSHNNSINMKANDKLEVTLYELMNIFGNVLYKGCTPLFKDNFIEAFKQERYF